MVISLCILLMIIYSSIRDVILTINSCNRALSALFCWKAICYCRISTFSALDVDYYKMRALNQLEFYTNINLMPALSCRTEWKYYPQISCAFESSWKSPHSTCGSYRHWSRSQRLRLLEPSSFLIQPINRGNRSERMRMSTFAYLCARNHQRAGGLLHGADKRLTRIKIPYLLANFGENTRIFRAVTSSVCESHRKYRKKQSGS